MEAVEPHWRRASGERMDTLQREGTEKVNYYIKQFPALLGKDGYKLVSFSPQFMSTAQRKYRRSGRFFGTFLSNHFYVTALDRFRFFTSQQRGSLVFQLGDIIFICHQLHPEQGTGFLERCPVHSRLVKLEAVVLVIKVLLFYWIPPKAA